MGDVIVSVSGGKARPHDGKAWTIQETSNAPLACVSYLLLLCLGPSPPQPSERRRWSPPTALPMLTAAALRLISHAKNKIKSKQLSLYTKRLCNKDVLVR